MSGRAVRVAIVAVMRLLGEPLSTRFIADTLELDWRTAYRHLTVLEELGVVEHIEKDGAHMWAVQIKGRVPIKEL